MNQQQVHGDPTGTLGGRIVSARESQDLTTSQLARRLGVRTATLRGWETDESEPRANRLTMLAGMLGVSPGWLLTNQGSSPSDALPDSELMQIKAKVGQLREKAGSLVAELAELEEQLSYYQS